MPFCPKCGKDIPPGATFCEEHKPNALDVKPFELRLCNCGRIFVNNKWVIPQDIESSLVKLAKESIKQKAALEIEAMPIPQKRGQKTTGIIKATHEGETTTIEFPIKHQRCDKCARMGTNYFTAKLQLRDPPAEALPYIEEHLAPLHEKGVAINDVQDTPRGPDLYLTHKSVARQLGEKLVRRFGGTMKSSEQLFSRNKQTSKNLYRLNVLVEFPAFTKGDAVLLEGKPVLVTGLGKQCTGRDLQHDKKTVFTAGDEEAVLKKHKTTIATTRPKVTLIHPVTFQQVPAANPPSMLEGYHDGQGVKVVIANKKTYLL